MDPEPPGAWAPHGARSWRRPGEEVPQSVGEEEGGMWLLGKEGPKEGSTGRCSDPREASALPRRLPPVHALRHWEAGIPGSEPSPG